MEVIELMGIESQLYLHEASKIWWSFLPDFSRICWGVMKQSPEPVRDVESVIVLFLLVHGGHDLVDLGADGRVVPLLPVQEGVVA